MSKSHLIRNLSVNKVHILKRKTSEETCLFHWKDVRNMNIFGIKNSYLKEADYKFRYFDNLPLYCWS